MAHTMPSRWGRKRKQWRELFFEKLSIAFYLFPPLPTSSSYRLKELISFSSEHQDSAAKLSPETFFTRCPAAYCTTGSARVRRRRYSSRRGLRCAAIRAGRTWQLYSDNCRTRCGFFRGSYYYRYVVGPVTVNHADFSFAIVRVPETNV